MFHLCTAAQNSCFLILSELSSLWVSISLGDGILKYKHAYELFDNTTNTYTFTRFLPSEVQSKNQYF